EMAENLSHLGIKVTLVEMASQVMTPLDFELAQIVHIHMRDKGVNLILNNGVKAFENAGKQVLLADGKVINTEMTVLAIGVKPENSLAKSASLAIGEKNGILVNEFLQTSDPTIYAIGDAMETKDFVTRKNNLIPLAGPANKQGRIAADNIYDKQEKYLGALGTSAVKVFDLTAASTGINEKTLKALNLKYNAVHIHPGSNAGYYPGSSTISLKILYNPETEEIYGAQGVGMAGVDKRIDILATAIFAKVKAHCLKSIELAYAPPFSSAKDPVNMLGFVIENIDRGQVKIFQWHEVEDLIKQKAFLLDVREELEVSLGTIPTSINIPFSQIRSSLDKLPKDKPIYLFCQSGVRGHSVTRILKQMGYDAYNLSGGYKTYSYVYDEENISNEEIDDAGFLKVDPTKEKEAKPMENKTIALNVNACGLQCPGPIVEVYKALKNLKDGDILEIKATDPGFMKDIKAWADKTKNTLVDVSLKDGIVTAQVQKGTVSLEENKDVIVSSNKENTTIVVFSQDLDKAIAAFIIATGAASMGKKVSLFFTFWGLNILRKSKKARVKKTFIEKMFGKMMPRGTKKLPISNMNMLGMGPKMIKYIMKKKNVDSLQTLMTNANSLGIKIIACAMSMDIMGIKKEELLDGIEIAGVATYLSETTEANHNLFI
ncbi:MAG: DsrE/DsrF/DrsH-like family protein, partial [Bacilli bacterium]|nr:DsrE/DsrF/DrsH-like family protein [Bacilli bacterium]